jgi:8-oxo-dGTP pyrophosphatase MutT (NUDIX family)
MTFLLVESAREPLVCTSNVRLQRTSSRKTIRGRLVGASLLCYSVDPIYSCVYFLLGKERHHGRWPNGSNRWADFGGRVAAGDNGAEDTAAREFFEETLAVVQYFQSDRIPRSGWGDIADDLRRGHYTMRLTQGSHTRKFVLFVKQIPWDPTALTRFNTYRSSLMQGTADNHPSVMYADNGEPIIRREFFEKKVLGLWSVPQLRRAIEHRGTTHRSGHVEHCRQTFVETLEIVLGELAFQEPGMVID